MGEDSLHRQIERYEELAAQVSETAQERDAVTKQGANVEAVGESTNGHEYRFEARLDRAALVAAVSEQLPDGFVVEHVNEDGSLTIEWIGERDTPSKREHGAVLKAIVAEELVTDVDGLVESAPGRERVIERAVELGVAKADARARLDRLATLGVVDVSDGEVLPGRSFSRF